MITIHDLNFETPKCKSDFKVIEGWSELYNPYQTKGQAETEKQVAKYQTYFNRKVATNDEYFMAELHILINTYKIEGVLGLFCHCHPKKCHCEVIKDYIVNLNRKEEPKMFDNTQGMEKELPPIEGVTPIKRGRGRPKGSKNKPKTVPPEPPIHAPEDNTREE